jgi:hypothetical protein
MRGLKHTRLDTARHMVRRFSIMARCVRPDADRFC